MLKWTVNVRRQTYLQGKDHLHLPSTQQTRSTQEIATLSSKTSRLVEEKQLHSSCPSFGENPPLRKLESLRDLSNIGAQTPALSTPKRLTGHASIANVLQTPEYSSPLRTNKPNNYASTLPTFDVEYSPSALMPCRSRALKGKSLQDMYFRKPRYLANNSALFG